MMEINIIKSNFINRITSFSAGLLEYETWGLGGQQEGVLGIPGRRHC